MWYVLAVNIIFGFLTGRIKSAWVEIPQVPTKTQFVFGSPRTEFPNLRFPVTTPTNYKTLMTTTPAITLLTTTTVPVTHSPRFREKTENTIPPPPKKEFADRSDTISPRKNKKTANKKKQEESTTFSGFLPLLQSIQDTLTRNAKKSLKSKISLLTNLRDNLLVNIDERMANMWQPIEELPEARGHDDHEMEFPSNEGALLTIGFLTFAVFLIKLVLKLIHALKNKQYTNGMTMAMTGMTGTGGMTTGAATYFGRKKRDIDDYDSMKILQLIDEYKFS